jgi:hypothetical protein
MATEWGEQHGLINTLPNSVKDNGFARMDPETKIKAEKMRKDESRMVKARYINHRGMHERLTKPYMRWEGDSIKIFHLIPGHTYELPYGFIKEVNENPGLKQRGEAIVDENYIAKERAPLKIHELVPIQF